MKIVLSHPTANNFVRETVNQIYDCNLLNEFHTSIAIYSDSFLSHLISFNLFSEVQRRGFEIGLKPFTHTYPWLEIGRLLSLKLGASSWLKHEKGIFCIDSVYHHLDKKVAKSLQKAFKKGARIAYAYEDGALNTFVEAKRLGMQCVYDLPIAYWEKSRQLLTEEAKRLPSWSHTLIGIQDSLEKLERKTRELQLADSIVVPSQFVIDSLPAWARSKEIVLSPFGSPVKSFLSSEPLDSKNSKRNQKRPLRVLFAGSMSQRKGLADLFQAAKQIGRTHLELVVMGSLLAPLNFYKNEYSDFIYENGRSNDQVLQLMKSCDVLCLPSIVEGRALVMQEAMSQGLPIIITPNTGGEDLIHEGETGFLVPIRDPNRIAEKIDWFLSNKQRISEMGECAIQHAATYTWKKYRETIVNNITNLN